MCMSKIKDQLKHGLCLLVARYKYVSMRSSAALSHWSLLAYETIVIKLNRVSNKCNRASGYD